MSETEKLYYINKWKPFIRKLAFRYKNTIASVDDLISEGVIGVLKALKTYNEQRGNIDSYICKCIKSQIIICAIENGSMLYCPAGTFIGNKNHIQYQHSSVPIDYNDDTIVDDKRLSTEEMTDAMDEITTFDNTNIATLYYLENKTYREIADIKGMQLSHVYNHLSILKNIMKRRTNNG